MPHQECTGPKDCGSNVDMWVKGCGICGSRWGVGCGSRWGVGYVGQSGVWDRGKVGYVGQGEIGGICGIWK